MQHVRPTERSVGHGDVSPQQVFLFGFHLSIACMIHIFCTLTYEHYQAASISSRIEHCNFDQLCVLETRKTQFQVHSFCQLHGKGREEFQTRQRCICGFTLGSQRFSSFISSDHEVLGYQRWSSLWLCCHAGSTQKETSWWGLKTDRDIQSILPLFSKSLRPPGVSKWYPKSTKKCVIDHL